MKKNLMISWACGALLLAGGAPAGAAVALNDWGLNLNGSQFFCNLAPGDASVPPCPAPAGVDAGGFDQATGLGSISFSFTGAGNFFAVGFFDHEIEESTTSAFNEYGRTGGLPPAAGQSWELDDSFEGDIFFNFLDHGTNTFDLDNTNAASETSADPGPPAGFDLAMAMAWDFTLGVDEIATIVFTLSDTLPTADFYLEHYDPFVEAQIGLGNLAPTASSVFLTSSLSIRAIAVPEPGVVALLAGGLLLVGASQRIRRSRGRA